MKTDSVFSTHIRSLLPIPTHIAPSGRLTSPIKCILFDVYGTLFISGTGDISIAQKSIAPSTSFQALLLKYKITIPPNTLLTLFFEAIEKQHSAMHAKGIEYPEVVIENIWSKVLQTADMDMVKQFALEFELIKNPVYPMPHLSKILVACHGKNIILGIVSNAQFYTPLLFQWFLKSDMTSLGFSNDLIFMSYQMGHAKPSASLFNTVVEKISAKGIQPNEVLFVGNDMRNDIYPANRAGFRTALFAGDARSLRRREKDPVCQNLKPDLVITDLRQILDCLSE